jgi:LysM domain-containing protein
MSKSLTDFPRPPNDNGRGVFASADPDWLGGDEGYDFWLAELQSLGIKWVKLVDENGNSLPFCEKLITGGIFPIVHILRHDPPPNDTTEPNPGHIGPTEEETITRLIAAGVRYFETNNEPNLVTNWKHNATPGDAIESAKIVALNWLFDARFILEAGGYPGLPAISNGGEMDLIGALVALGRQDILLEGAWIALHNYGSNRPIDFPDDPINRTAEPLTNDGYDQGAFTAWAWWNQSLGRANTLEEINQTREEGKNSVKSILQNHACSREFEYYNFVAMKYLGISIPIISTAGGYRIGCRDDQRYPRITPETHCGLTLSMFDYVQRQAPDYYFAMVPSILAPTAGWEVAGWYSAFWQHALSVHDGRNGLPPIAIPDAMVGNRLPIVDAVKQMPNLARRMPGAQPVPPPTIELPAVDVTASERPESGAQEYIVKDGDSLSIIARRFGTTWQNIAILNQIATPNLIRPGQPLFVPAPKKEEAPAPEPARVEPIAAVPQEPVEPIHEYIPTPPPSMPEEIPPAPQINLKQVQVAPNVFQIKVVRPIADPMERIQQYGELPSVEVAPPELEWDPRLEALNVGIYPTEVDRGKKFWKLIRATYQGPEETGEHHDLYFNVMDDKGNPVANQRVWLGWRGNKIYATTDGYGQAVISLNNLYVSDEPVSDLYFAGVDGLASDRAAGISLHLKRNESFVMTWRRTVQKQNE